jgi:protein involved in polysaccharide export with SLBB domain
VNRTRAERAVRAGPVETRRIIELHRAGASAETIAAALNKAGLSTALGRRWHAVQVMRVIDSATVRGYSDATPSNVDEAP